MKLVGEMIISCTKDSQGMCMYTLVSMKIFNYVLVHEVSQLHHRQLEITFMLSLI